MMHRLGMVVLFAILLACGIALSRAAPVPDANGNPALPVNGGFTGNLDRGGDSR